jgi:hypothetical protein
LESLSEEERVSSRDGREFHRQAVSPGTSVRLPGTRPRAPVNAIENERYPSSTGPMSAISGRAVTESSRFASSNAPDESDRWVESDSAGETEAIAEQGPYTPLIAAAFDPSPPVTNVMPAGKSGPDSPRPYAQRSPATDDIEIHIGRIEVTAIQPTPVRIAPDKPQRRATSLDEYLKRRDGGP